MRYPVPLERTPCNFGCCRYWFLCPAVAGGSPSSTAWGLLPVPSLPQPRLRQSNEDRVARLNRKMRKLRAKAGGSGDDLISRFPDKPKGMHWETFLRLEQKVFEANREKLHIMSREISCLEAEIGVLPADPAEGVL
jgi:hypothetical protein